MKKICFFMAVLLLLCFFLSCGTEDNSISYSKDDYTAFELGRFAGLDEDVEWQIVQAYLKKLQSGGKNKTLTINDVWVDQYYGSYCPLYLFPESVYDLSDFIRTDYLDPKNQTVVAVKACVTGMDYSTKPGDVFVESGYGRPAVLRFYDKSSILLWEKGHLYDMENLDYSNRLIAGWDSLKIINRYNGLDFETDATIREDIGKFIMTGWPVEEYVLFDPKYLGTYNGYTALAMYTGAVLTTSYHKIIDGVHFWFYYKPIHIFAWKEGAIYELDSLFEQGLITHEDLVEMAYFHHAWAWHNDAWQEIINEKE